MATASIAAGREVLLGVDVGTSAVKVLACTFEGHAVAEATETYELVAPRPGWVEQDAGAIYRAVMRTLRAAMVQVRQRGDDVRAIGLSSAMHGLLPVDDAGEPLGPLWTWMDRRSANIAERWRGDGTALELYQATGAPTHPMLPVCKLRWLSENDSPAFAAARRFVSMKELIVHRWTGEWAIDHGIASATGLFDFTTRAWSARALELARVEPDRLATPRSTHTSYRALLPAVAETLGVAGARAALILCSSDGALANLGVGAIAPSDVALTLGTSGAVRVMLAAPALDDRARTFCYVADDVHYIAGGSTSSAGAVLNWLVALLLHDTPAAERLTKALADAADIAPGADGLTMLPFLSGERAPYWESALRGSIVGLDLAHDRRHIFRAAFESIVFALYSVQTVLNERAGPPQRIVLSGGLTHAPLVRALIADTFDVRVVLPSQGEASAFGAAMMAGHAVGVFADQSDIARTVDDAESIEPDPVRSRTYGSLFARYRAIVEATFPLFTQRPGCGPAQACE